MLNLLHKFIHYEEYLLICFFFVLEQFINNPGFAWKKKGRVFNNVLLKVLMIVISLFAAKFFAVAIIQINKHQIGLFYLLKLPELIKIIIGVLVIDFAGYWIHRYTHSNSFLWKLHRIHHSDIEMDASTNWRGHPLEGPIFVVSRIAVAALLGIDFPTFGVYVLILVPVAVLSHVNLKFPKWIDKSLGLIILTPNFHKVHHDDESAFTNSNYGECFIIWDRIFGTFKQKNIEDINYGLQEFQDKKKQSLWYMLQSPFLNQ